MNKSLDNTKKLNKRVLLLEAGIATLEKENFSLNAGIATLEKEICSLNIRERNLFVEQKRGIIECECF